MPRGTGGIRRVVAALLALALLVVPGVPIEQATLVMPLRPYTVHHCVTQGDVAQDQPPASHRQDHSLPGRHPGGVQDLACCASAQCPAAVAVPLVPLGQLSAPSCLRLVGIATRVVPDGIAVDPPLHPPHCRA